MQQARGPRMQPQGRWWEESVPRCMVRQQAGMGLGACQCLL